MTHNTYYGKDGGWFYLVKNENGSITIHMRGENKHITSLKVHPDVFDELVEEIRQNKEVI